MIKLYGVKRTENMDTTLFNKLIITLPKKRQKIINIKFRTEDKEIILLSQVLLRTTLMKEFNIKPKNMDFGFGEYGKPYLKDVPDLHFNLSHSGDWAVLAVSDKEIGIDVEKEKNIDLDIGKEYFSYTENIYLNTISKEKKYEAFFKIWTLKESYIKAIGLGLNKSLKSFSVMNLRNMYIITDNDKKDDIIWNSNYFKIDNYYHVSVFFQGNLINNPIKVYNSEKLINDYL